MIQESKVQPRHLKRNVYLYVRQSTLRQVIENTESTQRQYALKQRAVALGWTHEQIIVIDEDQGQSGASSKDREGFQRLVAEAGMGRAGIVMGLEVSRLARNNADWHRLLEICALTDTLILDEDGLYDPAHFNDRLLLGLKGTMSEAELHIIKARLLGGVISKARRGELRSRLPIGFIYHPNGKVILDPDRRMQHTLRTFFQTFQRTGSALAIVKAFREQELLFPKRIQQGPHKDEVIWSELDHNRALWILHNPRYAGAFFYGRHRQRKYGEVRCMKLPPDEWVALIREAHPGYISWEQFERNEKQLAKNSAAHGEDRRHSPPREGSALLQGLVICGLCGKRMTVSYYTYKGKLFPVYACKGQGTKGGEPRCQYIHGKDVDETIGDMLLEAVAPASLEVALAVQQELEARFEEAHTLRRQAVEQARYEADLARRRYMSVDPANRLVADSLEAEWNEKLRKHGEAQEHYERERKSDRSSLDEKKRDRIFALASDFPALWKDPATPDRERKRMVRLLIEDVTLIKSKKVITMCMRFHGGATKTLTVAPPVPVYERHKTPTPVVDEVDRLLDSFTDAQIAGVLNGRGLRSAEGKPFTALIVRHIKLVYHLKPRYDRLREAGMLTKNEIARELKIAPFTAKAWRTKGWLPAHAYNDHGGYLYEPPGEHCPAKYKWKKGRFSPIIVKPSPHMMQEVQYEA